MTERLSKERRNSARHPMALKVQILYRRRRFYTAQVRNLSMQGMYLKVRNLTLPPGTLVELEMDCLGHEWLLEAMVVHRNVGGVGVMFREPQPALYQGLIQGQIGVGIGEGDPPPVHGSALRPVLQRH